MSVGHAERVHAKLSASGSSRWLACPGSVQLEEQFPDTTTEYAEEGTAAHELSELYLGLYLGTMTKRTFNKKLKEAKEGNYYSKEMEYSVQQYVDFVIERINEIRSKTSDAVVLIEHRLDFSEWVPGGFGTGDVVIIAEGVAEIIDLKYGKGVPVSAINNSQARLYGLGALSEFEFIYEIDTVRVTIVQPRLDSISTEDISVNELLEWADKIVKPKALEALSGESTFQAGDHCKWCKAKAQCRTRAEANLKMLEYEFQEPCLLSENEIADILGKADELIRWAGEVKDFALDQAERHGVKFPGWKLVEGRSNRTFTDKEAVVDTLILEGFEENQIYKPRDLLGITALEKVVGKKRFGEILHDFIIKPSGKPTLADESDPRPELNSLASTEADFAETDFDD